MLICTILWIIWAIWAFLCFTVFKDIDKDWHVIIFWLLLTVACCSIPVWLLIKHPFYYWLLCKH